jgi:hypothetical protein
LGDGTFILAEAAGLLFSFDLDNGLLLLLVGLLETDGA